MDGSNLFTPQERLASLKAGLLGATSAGLTYGVMLWLRRAGSLGNSAALAASFQGLGGLTFGVAIAIAAISGFLFSVTYRYAVRTDANPQLKAGVALAFGLVRGLAQVDVGSAVAQQFWPFVGAGVESLILFLVVQACLELAMAQGWLSRFGA